MTNGSIINFSRCTAISFYQAMLRCLSSIKYPGSEMADLLLLDLSQHLKEARPSLSVVLVLPSQTLVSK